MKQNQWIKRKQQTEQQIKHGYQAEKKQQRKAPFVECWDPEKHSFARAESLLEALGFADWHSLPRVVSLVGAGGKTSTMYDLAGELADRGARVLVTTSTHIFKPDQYETVVLPRLSGLFGQDKPDQQKYRLEEGRILAAGKRTEKEGGEGKLCMPDDLGEETVMEMLLSRFDVILIEADGSKCLPVKVPCSAEPVLIPQTGLVVACAGLTALGETFESSCFRFSTHGPWLKRNASDRIEPEDLALILMDERGSRKGAGGRYYRIILNQADTERERRLSEMVVHALPEKLQQACVRTTREACSAGEDKAAVK